jgi:anthranilate synthase component 1
VRDKDVDTSYDEAIQQIDALIDRLQGPPIHLQRRGTKRESIQIASNMDEERFKGIVRRAKEYIRAGDVIQVVLSQRFQTQLDDMDTFDIYRALRRINPSPYMFYLNLDQFSILGSSPEILVRVEGRKIELRPIAGTRPRGKTKEEDRRLEEDLLRDPKERSEHIMLVDLGRNDVGRVAEHGSVEVNELMVIERYSHVMHIVSNVLGTLNKGCDCFDVLRASFPAGTVTGAPKIRAMEIIEELEPTKRGPYAGAVGYFSFTHNMDFCITIRSIIIKGSTVYFQVGAGIVADSDPHMEYLETVNKAKAMAGAIQMVAAGLE